jgi:hypothetical protein|tara:strand:+ start:57 stop:260 length:204 start_codon:yes stop_codon:yes gene_type:complete
MEEEHVLGCEYDQSVGTGTIVLHYNGKPGPIPGGLRGIQGTCKPPGIVMHHRKDMAVLFLQSIHCKL